MPAAIRTPEVNLQHEPEPSILSPDLAALWPRPKPAPPDEEA
ncbi:MAG: hypothetical protein QJR08_03735 [Bacillota bacterium]|nr:hypothetical protein [Bacillota bacterium]